MRERIALLAGEFRIRSAKGSGTAVTVEIPWAEKKRGAGGSVRRRPEQEKRG
jgi:signal transduction histidine kinase